MRTPSTRGNPPWPTRFARWWTEALRAVRIVFPPLEKLADEEARAALERALDLRREWERKGYVL